MAKKRMSQDDVDADLESVSGMADRMGLKDKTRDNYIHRHMTSLGHRPQTSYIPGGDDDDDDDDDDGGFFGSSRNRNKPSNRGRRSNNDDDW